MKKKSLIVFLLNYTYEVHLAKDPASYAYYLSRDCHWQTSFAYFSDKPFKNSVYEKHVRLIYLGNESSFEGQQHAIKEYISLHYKSFDVVMLMNYGSATYRIANYTKSLSKDIKIYSKLDMGENGFSHFFDGTFIRKIKNIIEIYKTRNIDLFSIENKSMYTVFKNMHIFKNRILYLPNCVSLLNVEDRLINDNYEKENIILTVGRLGDWYKHNELLLKAIANLPDDIIKEWKFYFVGPFTKEIYEYGLQIKMEHPKLSESIIFTGSIDDRNELYKMYIRAKIFVLSSRSESFGISTVEAMYFGAYPVLTNFGSIANDITLNEKYGCVVDNNDALKLKNGILQAIEKAKSIKTSEEIQKYARERFSYSYWAKELSSKLIEG